jgi:hypothetical protein
MREKQTQHARRPQRGSVHDFLNETMVSTNLSPTTPRRSPRSSGGFFGANNNARQSTLFFFQEEFTFRPRLSDASQQILANSPKRRARHQNTFGYVPPPPKPRSAQPPAAPPQRVSYMAPGSQRILSKSASCVTTFEERVLRSVDAYHSRLDRTDRVEGTRAMHTRTMSGWTSGGDRSLSSTMIVRSAPTTPRADHGDQAVAWA